MYIDRIYMTYIEYIWNLHTVGRAIFHIQIVCQLPSIAHSHSFSFCSPCPLLLAISYTNLPTLHSCLGALLSKLLSD